MPGRGFLELGIVMSTLPSSQRRILQSAAADRWLNTARRPAARTAAVERASIDSTPMSGNVDPPVKAMKAAGAYTVGYGLAGQPRRHELPPRHDAVLALGEPSDHDIRVLAVRPLVSDHDIRTLVAFYVYMTFKATSVAHADQDGRPYCARGTRSVTIP